MKPPPPPQASPQLPVTADANLHLSSLYLTSHHHTFAALTTDDHLTTTISKYLFTVHNLFHHHFYSKASLTQTIERRGFPLKNIHWKLYGHKNRIPYYEQLKESFEMIETGTDPQAADNHIKDDLTETILEDIPCYIVLCAGDGDYTKKLMEARNKGFGILVIGRCFDQRMSLSLLQFHFSDWNYILLS